MIKIKQVQIFLLFLLSVSLWAETPEEVFQQGEYEKAGMLWERNASYESSLPIISQFSKKGEYYYNAGVAYYKATNYEKSLLNFRRSEKYNFFNSKLANNISLTRKELDVSSPQAFIFPSLGKVGAILFIAVWFLFWGNLIIRKKESRVLTLSFALLLLWVVADFYYTAFRPVGMVLTETAIYQGDSQHQPQKSDSLPKGGEVTVIEKQNAWYRVRYQISTQSPKETGWVKKSGIHLITPEL